ncbi:MAG: hypothetical protein E6Q99_07890 [Elusimicrobia bacterium]|jgi:caa(3)-type oxidase subunit IV|nr:MAG: hypothetical protein E6Q99_07890 [Elusimicrobiota bacterium]
MNEKSISNALFGGLIAITLVSVAASRLHFGRELAVAVALGFAAVKAALIGWFFMRLRHEGWIIRGAVLVGVFAVLVMAVGILPDLAIQLK